MSTKSGFLYAKKLLVEVRPRNLWMMPPQHTVSNDRMSFAKGSSTLLTETERKRQQKANIIWHHYVRLCLLQAELGGIFYIEGGEKDQRWVEQYSNESKELSKCYSCIRHLCGDGITSSVSWLPIKKRWKVINNEEQYRMC